MKLGSSVDGPAVGLLLEAIEGSTVGSDDGLALGIVVGYVVGAAEGL